MPDVELYGSQFGPSVFEQQYQWQHRGKAPGHQGIGIEYAEHAALSAQFLCQDVRCLGAVQGKITLFEIVVQGQIIFIDKAAQAIPCILAVIGHDRGDDRDADRGADRA